MDGNTTLPQLEKTTFEDAVYLPTPCPLTAPTSAPTLVATLALSSVGLRQRSSTQWSQASSEHSYSNDSACHSHWQRLPAKAAVVASMISAGTALLAVAAAV